MFTWFVAENALPDDAVEYVQLVELSAGEDFGVSHSVAERALLEFVAENALPDNAVEFVGLVGLECFEQEFPTSTVLS